MTLTNEGYEFIGYARQVIQQYEILEEKYIEDKYAKKTLLRIYPTLWFCYKCIYIINTKIWW